MKSYRLLILVISLFTFCAIGISGPPMVRDVSASAGLDICANTYSLALSDPKKAYGTTEAAVEQGCIGLFAAKKFGIDPTIAPKCVDLRTYDCLAVKFMRGDANGNGIPNETRDLQIIFNWLYKGETPSDMVFCLDAFDRNDDGTVDISDTSPLTSVKAPSTTPGVDPTPDSLRCDYYPGNLLGESFPIINGVCEATNNTCTVGTFSDTPDTATNSLWQCVGSNGGTTASCSLPIINGACGAANNACTVGTFNDIADIPPNSLWQCVGTNGGTTASCSLPIPVNGVCGATNNVCFTGTLNDIADVPPNSLWQCTGSSGGTTASCSLPKVNGVCGTTNNACTQGTTYDMPADTTTNYLWSCTGTNGGTTASCSLPKPVNGVCGAVNNTCAAGTLSDTPDTATNSLWSCVGANGGATTSCSFPKINGVCGATNNACSSGTFSDTTDTTTNSLWNCVGSNNGTTASCSLAKVNGACGATNNACTAGILSDTPDTTTSYLWSCVGFNGGTTASCSLSNTSAATYSLTASPASITKGQSFTVTWSGQTSSAGWIGFYQVGETDNRHDIDSRSAGQSSGSVTFGTSTMTASGKYEFRLFGDSGYTKLLKTSSQVTVN